MKSKKVLSLLLVICVLSMLFPMNIMAKNDSDLKGHWSERVVQEMAKKGYIDKLNNGNFNPNSHVTRSEFVTMFDKAISSTLIKSTDVSQYKELDWFDMYVKSLIEQDPLEGDMSEYVISPNKKVSREEVVVIVATMLGLDLQNNDSILDVFLDSDDISDWSRDKFSAIVKKGIIKGNNNKLCPLGKITKAEVVVILQTLVKMFAFETISFEDGIPDVVSFGNSEGEIVTQGATDGDKALRVNYDVADFPTVKFTPERVWNFGKDVALSLDVTNPTDVPVTLNVRMDDSTLADGVNNSTVSIVTILPNTTESIYMSYSESSIDLGMRGLPPSGYGTNVGRSYGETSLDTTNITQFQFWLLYNLEEVSLIFDNIKIIPDPNVDISYTDNIVDEFGQYTGLDWEGKVKSVQDLLDDKAAEAIELENGSSNFENTNQYGGWLDGPNLGGTGYFRTEKYNGVWSIVDPEGYLFFATGVDILRLTDASTWIDGRRNMFESIPDPDGPLGDHYTEVSNVARPPLGLTEGLAYNFFSANLEQKYGENYLQEWRDISVKRFKNWGFSTIGNWAEPTLFFGKGEETKFPYVATGLTITGNHTRIVSRNGNLVADPFDPEFKVSVQDMVQQQLLQYGVQNDPWCMGVYVDNEIEWGSDSNVPYIIATNSFLTDANATDSYAKRAFIQKLKETYTDIQALNSSWGTEIASWEALEAPYTFPAQLNAGMTADLSMMMKMLAREYFSTIDEELESNLPNLMYLGCRFATWGASSELQDICAEYVDIVSYNVYSRDVDQAWIRAEQNDKPCIVGEFHFGATDRGMFNGGIVTVESQEARGVAYQEYLKSVLNSPYFVGAHWFQYMDQPLIGRAWDGENYNTGFVDVADVPYQSLVDDVKEIHSDVYRIRYNKTEVTDIVLNKTEADIDATVDQTLQLTASVLPDDADFKNVLWSTSDTAIATVDENGLVTALKNGTVEIVATSESNNAVTATCQVTVTGFAAVEVTMPNISFEESEDLSIVTAYKEATTEFVTDGVTDGSRAIKVNVGTLDTDYSGIQFAPSEGTWSWGSETTFFADITNPNDEGIQLRTNILDANGTARTYYFSLAANSTRTIEISNLGPAEDYYGADGWFGGNAGIDQANITLFNMYLWEDNPSASSSVFIVDNIKVYKKILNISFEEDEDLSIVVPYKEATVEYVSEGATDGARAMSVNVGTLDTDYSGFNISPTDALDFGATPVLTADLTNSSDEDIQLRINVTDQANNSRTFYFGLGANSQRTITISNFGPEADYFGADGWFGANGGLDTSGIKTLNFYLWEDKDGTTVNTFTVDNIVVVD